VLLVEQQLEVLLAATLVSGAGLDGDQALLFNAGAVQFLFFTVELLQLGFGLF